MSEDGWATPALNTIEYTKSAAERVRWLASAVSLVTCVSFVGMVFGSAAGYVDLSGVSEPFIYVYAAVVLASYSFALDVKLLNRVGSVIAPKGK